MTDHAASIRARRAQSNAAIARRSADETVAVMMDDVSVAVAGGPTLRGREASRAAFTEQFADPAFHGYVRAPERITLADPPVQATEMGRWSGQWGTGLRAQEMRGTYVAQWTHTALGWFIQSEVFVSGGGSA
jgi:ketosteroid isomerase-like protein